MTPGFATFLTVLLIYTILSVLEWISTIRQYNAIVASGRVPIYEPKIIGILLDFVAISSWIYLFFTLIF